VLLRSINISNFLYKLYFEASNGQLRTIFANHLKSNYADVKDLLMKKQGKKKNNKVMDDVQ
jgi:hypothetical protein